MYKIRLAKNNDIDIIMNIMDEVTHPLFVKDDRDYVIRHIKDEGFILVAENKNVDAYLMIHYCDYDPDVNLYHVAYMDSVGVSKVARGQGLMKILIEHAEKMLEGEYCYCMATVHPDNIYSLNNFILSGYEIINELNLKENYEKAYD